MPLLFPYTIFSGSDDQHRTDLTCLAFLAQILNNFQYKTMNGSTLDYEVLYEI